MRTSNLSVVGSLNSIKDNWDKLTAIGPKYGYFPKPTKSYDGKRKKLIEVQNLFANSRVNITAEGKRHLGAVVESTKYRHKYMKGLVKYCDNQLTILSIIAETQPQAAYLAYASWFKSKLNYFLRTIPNNRHLLLPLERTISNKLIPSVTGSYICR